MTAPHFVAADGVLRRSGDEDDHDVAVLLADGARGVQAIHSGHFDVQQQDVVDRRIAADEFGAVIECRDDETLAFLALIAIEIVEYRLAGGRVVFDHADSNIAHFASAE